MKVKLALTVLALIAIYVYPTGYVRKMQKATTSPTPSSILLSSPTSSASDATTDWRTYTHPEGLFSLKYPTDKFSIVENRIQDKMATVCKTEIILVAVNNKKIKTDFYVDGNMIIDACMNPPQSDFPHSIFSNIEGTQTETLIDSKKAYSITGLADLHKLNKKTPTTRVAIQNNGQFTFDLIGNNGDSKTEIFNQILSTFKFMDSQ